jgi:capsular exopolysaccharide synthesis family protein
MSTEADTHGSAGGGDRLVAAMEPSLIEAVLRRQPRARRSTLWHTDAAKPGVELILAHDLGHPRSEAIRALRTKLLVTQEQWRRTHPIAVLSPSPAEGRSQLCAELAIAFAQLRRATLLVDADLRHPRQHVLFGADNRRGVAQALGECEPPTLFAVEGLPDLALLTSGGVPANPLELLSRDHFERLMKVWQREYEFVLIDTPPMSLYSDGLAVASLARRALVVSRAPRTSFRDLKEMMRQLAAAPTAILGAVINRF